MVGLKSRKWLHTIVIAVLLLFFYLPIITMIVFSFNSSKSLSTFSGFSLRWYQQVFRDPAVLQAVWVSLTIALLSTIISTFIGTLSAIGLSKMQKTLQQVLLTINDLPMLNPDIVTAISLMLLFVFLKIPFGYLTMLLAHISFSIPYVILSVMPKLRQLDENTTEAALDLGATPQQALWKVIIPQIIPGIVSGALIAFTMSFDDFVISYFVSGNGVQNISILVYTMSKRINPTINALSTLLVVIISIFLIFINVIPMIKERKEKRHEKISY